MSNLTAHREEMLDLYHQGYSLGEIGKIFDTSRQRVHQLIGDLYDEPHNDSQRLRERRETIRQANARVLVGESTIRDEAARLGILRASLIAAFHRYGLDLPPQPVAPLHGTYYRYQEGCRCEECREASRDYRRQMKMREPPQHGTASAYRNFACRCDDCRIAGSLANKRDRERQKERRRVLLPAD